MHFWVIQVFMERLFLRQLGFDALRQVLLTVGFALLFQQAALDIWGGDNMDIKAPAGLDWSVQIGKLFLPVYRLFMIAVAGTVGLSLWLIIERTRIGAIVRATVDDAEMARGVGLTPPVCP
jgi:branched-chain amino acid transport system permease protein